MGMEQTIEELLSQKTPVLYKAAHVSIRQLAEKLRTAMKDASKGGNETKAVQHAYGLPFIKSLKLWVQAVSKSAALKPLVEPLAIVLLAAIRAKESHLIYLPYVSILLGLVNDLSLNCEVFIPISSSCLSALTMCAHKLALKTLTAEGREPNISDVVRVSDRQLKDKRVVRGLTLMIVKELSRHLAFIGRTTALPEIGWPVVSALRNLSKTNSSIKPELTNLISCLDKSIEQVREMRTCTEGPLFAFEFEQTAIGQYAQKLGSEPVKKHWEEDAESQNAESEDEPDSQDEIEIEKSKRSLKRQRQNEKRKLAKLQLAKNPTDSIISKTISKIEKFDLNTEVVPFEVSDSE